MRPQRLLVAATIAGLTSLGGAATTSVPRGVATATALVAGIGLATGSGAAVSVQAHAAISPAVKIAETSRNERRAAPYATRSRQHDEPVEVGRISVVPDGWSQPPGQSPVPTGPTVLASWTVRYGVGPANGDGVNVDLALRHLDGVVIQPGERFDFWHEIGEVSRRTGYRSGGMIVGDHVVTRGALGGGICTVSVALFNAAMRAGLPVISRSAHAGHLPWYPLGLDAAVAKGHGWTETLAFRNDAGEPVMIRTTAWPGMATMTLVATAPVDRQVTLRVRLAGRRTHAADAVRRTAALPPGERRRVRLASDGMTVGVVRVVRDARGRPIRRDIWRSEYRPLNGLTLVGA